MGDNRCFRIQCETWIGHGGSERIGGSRVKEVDGWGKKIQKNICGKKKVALNQAGEVDASLSWV